MRGGKSAAGVKSAVRRPAAQTSSESLEVADRVGRSKTRARAPLTSTLWWWTLRCAFGSGFPAPRLGCPCRSIGLGFRRAPRLHLLRGGRFSRPVQDPVQGAVRRLLREEETNKRA